MQSDGLLKASRDGNTGSVRLLLRLGADVHRRDENGRTALHLALLSKHSRIANILLRCGADINARDDIGRTPIHNAVDGQILDEVEFPCLSYPDVNARDDDGTVPLHIATMSGAKHMVRTLLSRRANVNCLDDSESTALHFASGPRLQGAGQVVQLLLEAGASVNCRDCSGRASLIHAVQNEFEETETIIKLLFEHGATDLGSCEGENALSLSRLCMNQKIYTMLLQHDKENRTLQLETQSDTTVIFQDKSATMKFGSLHDDPELTSDTLYQIIAQGDVETLQGLLERQIDRVASAGFHWLKDLVDSGMDMHEIAELLVDVESQTPWKHYEPEATCSPPCSPFFHRSSCIHCASARPKASCKIREISTPPEERDIIKRKIVE